MGEMVAAVVEGDVRVFVDELEFGGNFFATGGGVEGGGVEDGG